MACRLISVSGFGARLGCTPSTMGALRLSAREASTVAVFATTSPVLSSSAGTAGGGGGRGRGFGQTRAGGPSSGAAAAATAAFANAHPNITKDGMLSTDTRRAMRDDTLIVEEIFRSLPQGGAVVVKSLYACLSPEVQEALSEKHGGLLPFLRDRQQLFVVKTRPEDGKMYVAGNPIAAHRFHVRSLQKTTVRQLMGLQDAAPARGPRTSGRSSVPRRDNRGPRDRQRAAPSSPAIGARTRSPSPPRSSSGGNAPRRQQFGV